MNDHTISCVSSQVDWLTCTAKEAQARDQLRDLGQKLALLETAHLHKQKPFQLHGIEGIRAGAVSYGDRDDITLVQVTGEEAGLYFESIAEISTHFSRLDLQVTLRYL